MPTPCEAFSHAASYARRQFVHISTSFIQRSDMWQCGASEIGKVSKRQHEDSNPGQRSNPGLSIESAATPSRLLLVCSSISQSLSCVFVFVAGAAEHDDHLRTRLLRPGVSWAFPWVFPDAYSHQQVSLLSVCFICFIRHLLCLVE